MLTVIVLFFVIFTILATSAQNQIDYCDKKWCPNQGQHIRCNNDGGFSKNCNGSYELVPMDTYIPLILHGHNQFRDYMAGGNLSCYYSACRMPVLTWDWNLAKNAEYNAMTCVFAHDACRSTPDYPYVGQNIYWAYTSKMNVPWNDHLNEAMFLWFDEWKNCNSSVMNSYTKTTPQSGHYTLMMNDRQTKVGCACLNNTISNQPPRRQVIFTCNYPSTNIHGYPSYKPGAPASLCNQTNLFYNNLCDDRIDPNDFYWYYK